MKYSETEKDSILDLSFNKNWSGRRIANHLGKSQSGVNKYIALLRKELEEPLVKQYGPKIAVFDLETAAALVYCFGRNKQFIQQDAVVKEGGWILMSGLRWLGEPEDSTEILFNYDDLIQGKDTFVVEQLYQVYQEADAVIAHNAFGFDNKMLQTRGIANGLGKLPSTKVIDTLQIARKALRLPSNRLDAIGAYFGLGRKVSHSGIDLWVRVQQGEIEAIEEMQIYCKQDTNLLNDIYLKLRGLGLAGTNFNAGHYYKDSKIHCSSCGSINLIKTGKLAYTALSSFEEYRCLDCGSLHRGSEVQNTKEQRKDILRSISN